MLTTPFVSMSSKAEIPHENYTLITQDMDVVVAMLNASIRASEDALRSFHSQDVDSAMGHIDVAASIIDPAMMILDEIEDLAPSHEQLSVLIPEFYSLESEMREFAELEDRMLSIRESVISIAMMNNISDVDAVAAIESVRELNIVLTGMNSTIEAMLTTANGINALTVYDRHCFVPNELVELIEALRSLTLSMHDEIAELIEEGIPWQDDRSYLLLWLADDDLYLGETLEGGGYLVNNGTFISGAGVDILVDGSTVASEHTNGNGSFSFQHHIPVNVSLLGTHVVNATAYLPTGTITSDTLWITVSLVPTELEICLSNATISLEEDIRVEAVLTREPSLPLSGLECVLSLDDHIYDFTTDSGGRGIWIWGGSELGIGTHVISAHFPETPPYASCDSGDETIVVDVPTQLTISLFSDRLHPGHSLVGEGLLQSAMHTLPGDQKIALSIDGVPVTNVSTDATGKFAFSIDTDEMGVGLHVLVARFIERDPYWRSSEAHAQFSIVSPSVSKYPFLPWIPGWDVGGGLQEQIPDLFFGKYSYFTWLFIILVVGAVIKALQTRRRRLSTHAELKGIATESEEPSVATMRSGELIHRERMPRWLVSPNEKVIWNYHSLVAHLKGELGIGIVDNMTHWEVAHLIESLGYPRGDVARIALLYEKAQYSGTHSSESDVQQMQSSSSRIRRSGGVKPAL